jgi:hypothetical protein
MAVFQEKHGLASKISFMDTLSLGEAMIRRDCQKESIIEQGECRSVAERSFERHEQKIEGSSLEAL